MSVDTTTDRQEDQERAGNGTAQGVLRRSGDADRTTRTSTMISTEPAGPAGGVGGLGGEGGAGLRACAAQSSVHDASAVVSASARWTRPAPLGNESIGCARTSAVESSPATATTEQRSLMARQAERRRKRGVERAQESLSTRHRGISASGSEHSSGRPRDRQMTKQRSKSDTGARERPHASGGRDCAERLESRGEGSSAAWTLAEMRRDGWHYMATEAKGEGGVYSI